MSIQSSCGLENRNSSEARQGQKRREVEAKEEEEEKRKRKRMDGGVTVFAATALAGGLYYWLNSKLAGIRPDDDGLATPSLATLPTPPSSDLTNTTPDTIPNSIPDSIPNTILQSEQSRLPDQRPLLPDQQNSFYADPRLQQTNWDEDASDDSLLRSWRLEQEEETGPTRVVPVPTETKESGFLAAELNELTALQPTGEDERMAQEAAMELERSGSEYALTTLESRAEATMSELVMERRATDTRLGYRRKSGEEATWPQPTSPTPLAIPTPPLYASQPTLPPHTRVRFQARVYGPTTPTNLSLALQPSYNAAHINLQPLPDALDLNSRSILLPH